ncbi:MAG: caspase family protein [Sphingobium sp.]|nr:caspase family protein [Sphingobium sp.]
MQDLPSAAAGAAAFCDWLIGEAAFDQPLASIEMLSNGPTAAHGQYGWIGRIPIPLENGGAPIDPRGDIAVGVPNTGNVTAAGAQWLARLSSENGNVGVVFICGHGVAVTSQPLVLLADLNENPVTPWSAFINMYDLGVGLKQAPNVSAAYIFVDACGEMVTDFYVQNNGVGAKFIRSDPFVAGTEKVALLAAAASNYFTFEDSPTTGGRFTQVLLRALRGASARNPSGTPRWGAYPIAIHEDLKSLYQLEPRWQRQPFEPVSPMLPTTTAPIVNYSVPPDVTVNVVLDPTQAFTAGTVIIRDIQGATLHTCPATASENWPQPMQASIFPHFVNASFGNGGGYRDVDEIFCPSRSLYHHVVNVRLNGGGA